MEQQTRGTREDPRKRKESISREIEESITKAEDHYDRKGREDPRKRKASTSTERQKLKGSDLGIKIHTALNPGWPKAQMKTPYILQCINENKFKITYTDNSNEIDEIFKLLESNNIELSNQCFEAVENSQFRKIRQGLQDRSPAGKEERKRRTSN